MNKRYVWNPRTNLQWFTYCLAHGMLVVGGVALIWLIYVVMWASAI